MTIGLVLLAVLIPLGVLAYDVTLIRQQHNQLKAATDAAVLAAANWANDSANDTGDDTTLSANAQKIALPYFRGNQLATGPKYSGSLSNAESATSDISKENLTRLGQSKLFVTVDRQTGKTVAQGAFCVQPSLLSFFGLYTLHTRSVVGRTGREAGDVCFVIDLSASMILSTPKSRHVVTINPRIKQPRMEKRVAGTPNLIQRFSVPGAIALVDGDPEADAMPNKIVNASGKKVRPYGAAGYSSFKNLQIPNPHYIDFVPNPNPNNYRPAGTPPAPVIPTSSAPRMKIDPVGTPLLFALMNDFAARKIDVPIPDDVVYPAFPSWPPVNPTKRFTYFDKRGSAAPATSAELEAGVDHDGSNPNKRPYDAGTPVKIKTFQTYTIPEMMTLVLFAAKNGLLDDKAKFDAAVPETTFFLKQFFPNLGTAAVPFKRGYQKEYNKLALTNIQPVETQVVIIHEVVDRVRAKSPDAHFSLVGFNSFAPGAQSGKPPSNEQSPSPGGGLLPYDWKLNRPDGKPQTADFYQQPLVPLDAGRTNADEVLRIISESTVHKGTQTAQALKEGIAQLNGPGHREGRTKTLILMTDGVPTTGGSIEIVKPNRKKNNPGIGDIKLVIVGLFESNFACPEGPNFCIRLKEAAGANAELFPINRMTRNCGKAPGDPSIDLRGDAEDISNFIVDAVTGGGSLGLIE